MKKAGNAKKKDTDLTSKDLSWFRLQDYIKLNKADLATWIDVISSRNYLRSQVSNPTNLCAAEVESREIITPENRDVPFDPEEFERMVSTIQKDVFTRLVNVPEKVRELLPPLPEVGRAVLPLTARAVRHMINIRPEILSDDVPLPGPERYSVVYPSDMDVDESFEEKEARLANVAYLSIDLSRPKSRIETDFKLWLNSQALPEVRAKDLKDEVRVFIVKRAICLIDIELFRILMQWKRRVALNDFSLTLEVAPALLMKMVFPDLDDPKGQLKKARDSKKEILTNPNLVWDLSAMLERESQV